MYVTISHSGGINHTKDLSPEAQSRIAQRLGRALAGILESFGCSGTGTVSVGERHETYSVNSTCSIEVE